MRRQAVSACRRAVSCCFWSNRSSPIHGSRGVSSRNTRYECPDHRIHFVGPGKIVQPLSRGHRITNRPIVRQLGHRMLAGACVFDLGAPVRCSFRILSDPLPENGVDDPVASVSCFHRVGPFRRTPRVLSCNLRTDLAQQNLTEILFVSRNPVGPSDGFVHSKLDVLLDEMIGGLPASVSVRKFEKHSGRRRQVFFGHAFDDTGE